MFSYNIVSVEKASIVKSLTDKSVRVYQLSKGTCDHLDNCLDIVFAAIGDTERILIRAEIEEWHHHPSASSSNPFKLVIDIGKDHDAAKANGYS